MTLWLCGLTGPRTLILAGLLFGAHLCSAGSPPQKGKLEPAQVSRLLIQPKNSRLVRALSAEGLIFIALKDCSLVVNGEELILRRGEFKQIPGSKTLEVGSIHGVSADLLLVNIRKTLQPLTIELTDLDGNQSLEDASDRNTTLLVAISSVKLCDTLNVGDESGWLPGKSRFISLRSGEARWVRAGIHHFKNRNADLAKFITVEW
jgi:hypothetical protein